jgi:hypothetical protein
VPNRLIWHLWLVVLPVRAEEVDQDSGDHLGRGVVIVSVELREPHARRGSSLFGD